MRNVRLPLIRNEFIVWIKREGKIVLDIPEIMATHKKTPEVGI
jgi:hypothetical protein